MEEKNIKSKKYSEVFFQLLRDYTYPSKLTRELYPRSKEKGIDTGFIVSQKVRVPFEDFGGESKGKRRDKTYKNYEKKPIKSKEGIRKTTEKSKKSIKETTKHKYSKKNQPAYRLKLSEYLMNYSRFNFSQRTLKILGIMFYPREIRKSCFNKKSFEDLKEIDLIFSRYLANEFIVGCMNQFITPDNSKRTCMINFDKTAEKFYKKGVEKLTEEEIEEISRNIYTSTSRGGGEGINNNTWLGRFVDEKFLFDILRGLKDLILIEFVIDKIFGAEIRLEKEVEDYLRKNYISGKEFKKHPNYNGKVIYDGIGIQDKETFYFNYLSHLFLELVKEKINIKKFPQKIKDSLELYKSLGLLEDKLKKEVRDKIEVPEEIFSVRERSFIPKIEEWEKDGKYRRLKKPKLVYQKTEIKSNPFSPSSELTDELRNLVD